MFRNTAKDSYTFFVVSVRVKNSEQIPQRRLDSPDGRVRQVTNLCQVKAWGRSQYIFPRFTHCRTSSFLISICRPSSFITQLLYFHTTLHSNRK